MTMLTTVEARIFDKRFPWAEIDREKALANPLVLERLREACLIESYFALYTGKMLQLFALDVEATSIFTIEAFEAYTHYACLRRYLDIVGYNPVTDEEVAALREKDLGQVYEDKVRELVNFGMTEHFAARFFARLIPMTDEPVLKGMLRRFSDEEVSHAEFAFQLLEKYMREDPAISDRILEHALHFQHVGAYVLGRVSPAGEDNIEAIREFNRRVEQLAGRRLSDYMFKRGGQAAANVASGHES